MKTPAVLCAIAVAIGLATFSVVRGTWAVGGSDSSCYALMADAFARGQLQPSSPLALRAPWPDPARPFAPGGFIPSPVDAGAASPVCTPGFSLLLAPFRRLGGPDGIFLFMPIAAGLLVLFTFAAARQLAGDSAGVLAAVVLATTPAVLFQAVQLMNDITTAMLWVGVGAAAGRDRHSRWWVMGAMTGVALLVRPNLAPVAMMVGLWVLLQSRSAAAVLRFGLAAAPGVVIMAMLNWLLYGSPFRLGYGSAEDLFSPTHVSANVANYSRAALETLTPFPVLAAGAPMLVARDKRPLVWLWLGMAAATILLYLLYRPFPEWWYLRFLLPAIAAVIVLASAALVALTAANVDQTSHVVRRRLIVVAIVAVGLAVYGVREGIARQAADLARLESRYRHAGHTVRDRFPANALFFTVWDSGSIRYHAGREVVLWDSLDPGYLDVALTWVRQQGFEPYLLLERWEEQLFRERFGERSVLGTLDWPPRLVIDRQVRIYSPADRAKYLAGTPVPTEHLIAR
jgi:hypothetical protein